jgi:hypothetical protein
MIVPLYITNANLRVAEYELDAALEFYEHTKGSFRSRLKKFDAEVEQEGPGQAQVLLD